MHIAQFLCHGPTYHSLAMWRHPRTAAAGYAWTEPELYQHIARVCERGKLDIVFFADLNYISDTYTGSLAPALRTAAQAPEHDPIPLISFMAAATERIGLGATYSVSHQHPFHAARLWATLDHLTRGRAAWNVVTTLNHNQSANFGEEMRPTDERYERAHEFIELCRKLWASWEPDALVMDREAGMFADPAKVHRVEHAGRFFKSRGPLNVVRSPWDGPAILQAGTSGKGRDFAARYADAVFAIQPHMTGMKTFMQQLHAAAKEADAPAPKVTFGMQPILGGTEAEAKRRLEDLAARIPLEAALSRLSGSLGVDFSKMELDRPLEEQKTQGSEGLMKAMSASFENKRFTLREAAIRWGLAVGIPQIVGTPGQVADQLEAIWRETGCHGFNLTPTITPSSVEEFVDEVVPILQRRGIFRTEYAGETFRENLLN